MESTTTDLDRLASIAEELLDIPASSWGLEHYYDHYGERSFSIIEPMKQTRKRGFMHRDEIKQMRGATSGIRADFYDNPKIFVERDIAIGLLRQQEAYKSRETTIARFKRRIIKVGATAVGLAAIPSMGIDNIEGVQQATFTTALVAPSLIFASRSMVQKRRVGKLLEKRREIKLGRTIHNGWKDIISHEVKANFNDVAEVSEGIYRKVLAHTEYDESVHGDIVYKIALEAHQVSNKISENISEINRLKTSVAVLGNGINNDVGHTIEALMRENEASAELLWTIKDNLITVLDQLDQVAVNKAIALKEAKYSSHLDVISALSSRYINHKHSDVMNRLCNLAHERFMECFSADYINGKNIGNIIGCITKELDYIALYLVSESQIDNAEKRILAVSEIDIEHYRSTKTKSRR